MPVGCRNTKSTLKQRSQGKHGMLVTFPFSKVDTMNELSLFKTNNFVYSSKKTEFKL